MDRAERFGRGTLLVDAVFCLGIGAVLVAARRRVARIMRTKAPFVAVAGGATIGWAGLVALMAVRPDWRRASGRVAAANLLATLVLMIGASVHPRRRARFVLTGSAIDAAVFAVLGLIALIMGRLPRP